jgi:fructokinase
VVVDGRALAGANAIAGEWGHNGLPWIRADELPGPRCGCGKPGHIEAFLSGPGLARDLKTTAGVALEAAQIVARADAGDAACEAALARYEERLARALASVINLIDPDVIVLGGGLSNADRLYRNVPKLWGPYVYSDAVATPLLPAKHGDASGVRGAARLW